MLRAIRCCHQIPWRPAWESKNLGKFVQSRTGWRKHELCNGGSEAGKCFGLSGLPRRQLQRLPRHETRKLPGLANERRAHWPGECWEGAGNVNHRADVVDRPNQRAEEIPAEKTWSASSLPNMREAIPLQSPPTTAHQQCSSRRPASHLPSVWKVLQKQRKLNNPHGHTWRLQKISVRCLLETIQEFGSFDTT